MFYLECWTGFCPSPQMVGCETNGALQRIFFMRFPPKVWNGDIFGLRQLGLLPESWHLCTQAGSSVRHTSPGVTWMNGAPGHPIMGTLYGGYETLWKWTDAHPPAWRCSIMSRWYSDSILIPHPSGEGCYCRFSVSWSSASSPASSAGLQLQALDRTRRTRTASPG